MLVTLNYHILPVNSRFRYFFSNPLDPNNNHDGNAMVDNINFSANNKNFRRHWAGNSQH